ncbi:hypothetical protein [Paraglaciecola arctica]|uniref:hypothetical protein n=1 Tax=Paraglaciecola arctica TaxID=1128911 RepID=UPI001C070379|nr:hypothetical protein [Paraglaciecola arctica]MBU3004344.1 hypothetical protein [Paraglaciecola arctica]
MVKQRILQSLLSVLLLIGSGFCLKLCLANIIAARPLMSIVDLERTANVDNVKELTKHFNRMQTAIKLFPSNANFYTLAGRYHLLLNQSKQAEYSLASTAQFFAKAIELEPTAFQHQAWQTHYLYQHFGWSKDIDIKLSRALEVGKYEKLSQQKLLPIAFENWQKLSKTNQLNTHKMLDNMFNTYINFFRQAVRVAEKYCVLDLLVTHAINAQQVNEIEAKKANQRRCK